LVFDFPFVKEVFDLLGALVVHAVELGLAASRGESVMHILDSGGKALGGPILHGPEQDVVAVIIVGDEKVVIAGARGDR
jgi:hypothetical protein